MTKNEMIEQIFYECLTENAISTRKLKIKARNKAIDKHYDNLIIEMIINLSSIEVSCIMARSSSKRDDIGWKGGKGWKKY